MKKSMSLALAGLALLTVMESETASAAWKPVQPHLSTQGGGFATRASTASLVLHFNRPAPFARASGADTSGPTGDAVGPPPVVTPEPISMALLAAGLAGVGGMGLRRRKNKKETS